MKPILTQHGIDKTIVIQAAPTIEETDYLLELYQQHDFIAGVVGWIDMDAPSFAGDYERLRKKPGFIGIRPMLQDIADDRWILRPRVMDNIGKLLEDDFPLDILIQPRHLPVIAELLESFPKLRAVINHAAKPDIKNGLIADWKVQINKLSTYENITCKISGLITEADHEQWKQEEIHPYIAHLVQTFGPDKLMFGSDWPVCLMAGSYQAVYHVFTDTISGMVSKEDKAKISGENAIEFYKLNL